MLLLTVLAACASLKPLSAPTRTQLAKPLPRQSLAACLANRSVSEPTVAPSANPRVVAIAGLLGGSTLVPLAQYVAGRWVRTWPLPDEEVEKTIRTVDELPRSWYPVPGGLPNEWFLWHEDLRGVPLHVGVPVLGEAHCQAVWGLSTRLQPFGHETTAIVTNGQADIEPFEYSALGGAADPSLRAFLEAEAERAEIPAIRSSRKDAEAVLAHRRDCLTYELSCVEPAKGDRELCSFEVSQQLGKRSPDSDPGCDDIVVVQGWFARSPEGFTLLQAKATLTDCDAKELRTVIPLVLIEVDARSFVVVREHGYEDESFAVLELRGNQLHPVLQIRGGGC
jgi:hypothetical protein